jgi:hypothetical protein
MAKRTILDPTGTLTPTILSSSPQPVAKQTELKTQRDFPNNKTRCASNVQFTTVFTPAMKEKLPQRVKKSEQFISLRDSPAPYFLRAG